jgi:glycosyltransferase involved in cell wall biosynthesis
VRIAQLAPLFESVPPRYYGGTERVVAYLTEELVRQGHEVTLFASGDSATRATLVSPWPQALRLQRACTEWGTPYTLMLEQVISRAEKFDVIHSHIDCLPFPLFRRLNMPTLSTLHGRLDLPELQPLFREFRDMPVVSISEVQRAPLPMARWVGTVYHGLPGDLFRMEPAGGQYLAFLGRMSIEKRPDRAIEIARRARIPVRIAAKVDSQDEAYFNHEIAPLLKSPWVDFVGEIGDQEKQAFLGNAQALLFPIDWPEPFGMVLIEAMACGTPVIAFRSGSVPEIIEDGVTGFVVDDLDGAVEAVARLPSLSRRAIRRAFEKRFTADRMAHRYVALYQTLLAGARTAGLEAVR